MSADNGVYIGKFPRPKKKGIARILSCCGGDLYEYRVAHCQNIENCFDLGSGDPLYGTFTLSTFSDKKDRFEKYDITYGMPSMAQQILLPEGVADAYRVVCFGQEQALTMQAAHQYAAKLHQEIRDAGLPVEYGVQEITFNRPLPKISREEAGDVIRAFRDYLQSIKDEEMRIKIHDLA